MLAHCFQHRRDKRMEIEINRKCGHFLYRNVNLTLFILLYFNTQREVQVTEMLKWCENLMDMQMDFIVVVVYLGGWRTGEDWVAPVMSFETVLIGASGLKFHWLHDWQISVVNKTQQNRIKAVYLFLLP